MSGSSPGSPGKKSSGQRLSLGPQLAPGRLGRLSKGPGSSGGTSQGAAAAPSSAPAAPAVDGPAETKPRRRFQPMVPTRRKKAAPAAAGDAANLGMDDKSFLALLTQADADEAWEKKGGRGRGRGRGRDPRLGQQASFGPGAPGAQASVKAEKTEKTENGTLPASTSAGKGRLPKAGAGPAQASSLESAKSWMPEDKSYMDASDDEKEQAGPMLNYDQYYPTMLPMREPGMEEGFGAEELQAGARVPEFTDEQEEQYVCSTAEALGLPHGPDDAEQILLFQMPSVLPMPRRPGPPPDPGPRGSTPAVASSDSTMATPFAELPQGKVGKLLVFKSGAVKLRVGGVLLDVAPGAPCQFRQDVAAINPSVGQACILGHITQRIVCSPNVEQLMSGQPIPDWKREPREPAVKSEPDASAPQQAAGPSDHPLSNGHTLNIKPEPMDEDGPRLPRPGRRKAVIDDDDDDDVVID